MRKGQDLSRRDGFLEKRNGKSQAIIIVIVIINFKATFFGVSLIPSLTGAIKLGTFRLNLIVRLKM